MHLVCYYPYYSCLCTSSPYHPYLVMQFFSCFLYLFVLLLIVHSWKHCVWEVSNSRVVEGHGHNAEPLVVSNRDISKPFGDRNTTQDYKINCKTMAKYLNIICIHQEKHER